MVLSVLQWRKLRLITSGDSTKNTKWVSGKVDPAVDLWKSIWNSGGQSHDVGQNKQPCCVLLLTDVNVQEA